LAKNIRPAQKGCQGELVSEEEKRSFISLTPEDPSCFAAGHAFPGIAEKRS
jgi:hypothetical protein